MAGATSRIALEITAESAGLQEAVTKAADSLKGLADVVAKTAKSSTTAGGDIVKSNRALVDSFGGVGAAAKESSASIGKAAAGSADAVAASATKIGTSSKAIGTSMDGAAAATVVASGRMVGAAEKADAGIGAAWISAGKKTSEFGRSLSSVSLPIAAIGAVSVDMAAKFQASMEKLRTQAGYTQAQVNALEKGVLAISPSIAQTPDAIAQGLYHIASVGIPAGKALDTVKAAAEGANISGANFEDVANLLATTMKNYPNIIGGAAGAMGILNGIVGAGNFRLEALSTSLGQVIPTATAVGLTLRDVGAAIDVMTSHGMPLTRAVTALRMALGLMETPSTKAREALASIGITQGQLANDMRQPNGLIVALDDLKAHLVAADATKTQTTQLLSDAFGNARSGAGMLSLIENTKQYADILTNRLPQGTKAVKELAAAQAAWDQTTQGQFDHIKAALAVVAVQLGQALIPVVLPALTELAGIIEKLAHDFEGLPAPVRSFIVAGLGVAALASPFILIGGKVLTLTGHLLNLAQTLTGSVAGAFRSAGAASTAAAAEVETSSAAMGADTEGAAAKVTTSTSAMKADYVAVGAAANTGATEVGAAMVRTEGEVAAAAPVLAADGAADGAAVGRGLLSGISGIVTVAAITAIVAEALKGPLQSLSQDISKATGNAIGSGYGGPGGLTNAQAIANAKKAAATLGDPGMWQTFYNQEKAAGAIGPSSGGSAGSSSPGNVVSNFGASPDPAVTQWNAYVQAAAKKYGIPASVLLGDIQQESGGNPAANSGAAQGLTQFTPGTAKLYGVQFGTTPADIASQVNGQAAYLSSAIKQYGSLSAALEDYYGGSQGVANPNEIVKGGPTPAQYAAQVEATIKNYTAYDKGGIPAPPSWSSAPGAPGGNGYNGSGGASPYAPQNYGTPSSANDATIVAQWKQYGFASAAAAKAWLAAAKNNSSVKGVSSAPQLGPSSQSALNLAGGVAKATSGGTQESLANYLAGIKSPSTTTSLHYNWQDGQYEFMTAAEYKQLQEIWNKTHPKEAMPTSPAAAAALQKKSQAFPTAIKGLTSLNTANATVDFVQGQGLKNQGASVEGAVQKIFTGDAKTGTSILGGLKDALSSGTLGPLKTQLNPTHTAAFDKIVTTLDDTHKKGLEKLAAQLTTVHKEAMDKEATLSAAAAEAAYEKMVSATVTALQKESTDLGTLYGAGAALGLPGQAGRAAINAQEAPLVGSTISSNGQLQPLLGQLIPQLESGPMSQAGAANWATVFAGGALGKDFAALASGKLDAADTQTTQDSINAIIGTLGTLEGATIDNTTATAANTSATVDNSQLISLLQQQNATLSQRVALGSAQTSVLKGFIPNIPHFASGGPVINDGLIYAHKNEWVLPANRGATSQGSPGQPGMVHVSFHDNTDSGLMDMIDARISHPDNVRVVSGGIGTRTRMLAGAPGGWR